MKAWMASSLKMVELTKLIERSTSRQDPSFVTGSIVGIVVGRGGEYQYFLQCLTTEPIH